MGVEQAISTKYVQESLPNLDSKEYKALLFDFHRQRGISYPRNDEKVKEKLVHTALALDKHERYASIWKCKYKKEGIQPIKFLVRKILNIEASSISISSYSETSVNSLLALFDSQELLETTLLENEDYEYLYYAVVCKIKDLYASLQLCFASRFLKLDTVLYKRAIDSLSTDIIFTVESLRDFLIITWHIFHDETVVSRLDKAIKYRKIRALTLSPQRTCESISTNSDSNFINPLSPCESILWNTVRGIKEVDNHAALLDSVYAKYSLGHHGSTANTITAKIKTDQEDEATELLGDPKNASVSMTQFVQHGTVMASLLCNCKPTCDCKFICNQHPDACICKYRQKSLGASSRRLKFKDIILHPPPKRMRDETNSSQRGVDRSLHGWNEVMVFPRSKGSRPPIPADFRDDAQSHHPNSSLNQVISELNCVSYAMSEANSATSSSNSCTEANLNPTLPSTHVMRQKSKRETSNSKTPPCVIVDQKSFRIPFEDGKYFRQTPQRQRYVRAGGEVPLDARSEVGEPFSHMNLLLNLECEEHKGKKVEKENEVRSWVDSLPDTENCTALGPNKSSRDRFGRFRFFGLFSCDPDLVK